MKRTPIPSWQLVRPSVELIRTHIVAFIYLILLPSLVTTLGVLVRGHSLVSGTTQFAGRMAAGDVLVFIGLLWSLINLGPSIYFQVRATHKAPEPIREYYARGFRFTLPVLGVYILTGLAILGGLILLIIPGLIMLRRYLLAPYYLVDKQLSVTGAMKQSAAGSKPFAGAIWGVIGVQLAITIISSFFGIIPVFGIVLEQIVVYAATFLYVLRYRDLAGIIEANKPKKTTRTRKQASTKK